MTVDLARSGCQHCKARAQAFCANLPSEDLESLERLAVRRELADSAHLCRIDDSNDYCANVLSGMLKLQTLTGEGRAQTVAILGPGDFFGQLFEEHSRLAAIAAGPVTLCVYSRVALEQLAARRPTIMRALLTSVAGSLEIARARQVSLAQKTAIARLAEFLIDQPVDNDMITLSLSRTHLANHLGMPIETLSRQFAKLKRMGIVGFQPGSKTILVRDKIKLLQIAD